MNRPRIAGPALLLALLALAGCDSEAAQLAKEITDAKGDCTQEKLKAGDEACVAMMEKYANIGTSAIETYIGAVKSMDQALQRMPPATFDTTFGHALTPAASDTSRLGPGGFSASRGSASGYYLGGDPGTETADPRYPSRAGLRGAGRGAADPRYAEPGYADPRYSDPRYADPAYGGGRYADPRDAEPAYPGQGAGDPRYADPRYPGPGRVDPRYSDPRYANPADPRGGNSRQGYGDSEPGRYDRRAPAAPAGRGLLLPPEERLQRPWIRSREEADTVRGAARSGGRYGDPRARPQSDYLPSDPYAADSLDREGRYRERDWRSDGY
jgi:hypothetical protein